MPEYKTYEAALKSGDVRIWPGCKGMGRCRPCGRVHDFQRRSGPNMLHDFRCLQNSEQGCPQPIPEPVHMVPSGKRNCSVCGKRPEK